MPACAGDAESGRLEQADVGVVAEQHVRDRVAGEADVEAVAAQETGRQIALQLPAPVVEAEVQVCAPATQVVVLLMSHIGWLLAV